MSQHRMKAEGAEIELRGDGFPPGAAVELAARIERLLTKPPEQQVAKPQAIEEIPDVVVQSAFAIVEDEMREDEANFAHQATAQPPVPPPTTANPRAETAWENFDHVANTAIAAGVFIIVTIRAEGDFESE